MIRHFLRDSRGAIAPLLALTILPLTAAVGVAVDFSRINAARTAMQTALDSTALMLSKTAATQTDDQLQISANTYFNALLTSKDLIQPTVVANYTAVSGSKIVLNATASVKTDIMNVFGYDQVTIKSTSTSEWGNTRLRVALVLDNTGSMADHGKMDALKTAAQNLLTQLKKAASDPEDVYVSIVPFNKDVNLNSTNYAQSWLRWDLWEAVERKLRGLQPQLAEQLRIPRRHLDGRRPQHLERLRHRPRPEFRYHQRPTARRLHALSGGAVFVLPRIDHGAEQRLDHARRQDHRHAARGQHQPGNRPAARLADADAVSLHHSGAGPEL